MQNTLTTLILICGAMLAAWVAALSMTSAVHLTSKREQGFMHLIFYAILIAMAIGSLLSGRDLSSTIVSEDQAAPSIAHPMMIILQPFLSLLILMIGGERILAHWLGRQQKNRHQSLLLLFVFCVFWMSTVAAPALLGAHPQVSHDYVYPLVIGVAATLASGLERDHALKAVRDALFIFMLLGLLLALVTPNMVLDRSYTQGLIPGLPRLAGLATHPVGMGLLSQLGLLCLMAYPYLHRGLNKLAWTVGLTSLFLAQSKTAWLAFLICAGTLLAAQRGSAFWRRLSDPMRPAVGMTTLVGVMLSVVLLGATVMFSDLGDHISAFMTSPEGAQLSSLTGRDRIWAIALEEWQRNPIFGYGPDIWGEAFRNSISMPSATHAHNQFMDTLSRSGSVGATGLLLYSVLLLFLSLRFTRATKGLSLALFLSLALRAITEVPLMMFGYGTEMINHVLLLMVLAAAMQEARSSTHPSLSSMPITRPRGGSMAASRFNS